MDMYRDAILDHYKHPRNFGSLKNHDARGEAYNATCGDRIVMEVKTKGKYIEKVHFSGEGCAISQASASMLTESAQGKTIKEIMTLGAGDVLAMLGTTLTPSRTKCGVLPLEVLQKALTQVLK